ncbi:hypothetical protein BSF40_13000 [Pseudomonas sp. ACN5]|nr:hypothetical protein BSF40_13000 [Pseudomonas sp. ACN5]
MLTAFSVASHYLSVEGASDNVGCFEFYSGCADLFVGAPPGASPLPQGA